MNLGGCRALITGAGSGIGRCLALALCQRGAKLALVGRNVRQLADVAEEVGRVGGEAFAMPFDLSAAAGHERLAADVADRLGGLDLLVNNAGISSFSEFTAESRSGIRALIDTNITAPMLLTHAALPGMLRAGKGRIVNVGSIFGSIGFPHYAAYSASKFALRGFSEALRRELADTGVGLTYVAPRSTRTAINSQAAYEASAANGTAFDRAEDVAEAIVAAIETDRSELYIGWPEKAFVRLNALLPRLVDGALVSQVPTARGILRGSH